ncbi:restriction endonuclease (plasmid) [Thioalkalivibrio sp. K90mix]|uniref:restriction endonuclease n=1 Tax=Thioalkalivibrio sp. (strain K90mix) TaxID=396595 RepID=UPI000195A71E|nr:restriction endonuclease [Thioalkalivibrio sp. K90mix]ADC73285.1 restriction endonuclease [Thioalkalivibrio sp. K90mix]
MANTQGNATLDETLDRLESRLDRMARQTRFAGAGWLERLLGRRHARFRPQESEAGARTIAVQTDTNRPRIERSQRVLIKIREILKKTGPGPAIKYLRKVDPYVFEELVLTIFEEKGYRVERSARYSGDGGVDGRIQMQGVWWNVQSKRYSSAIDPADVQAFADLCEQQQVPGLFVHSGRTGGKSAGIARRSRIQILSGEDLIRKIGL